jgi:hypothetical protein
MASGSYAIYSMASFEKKMSAGLKFQLAKAKEKRNAFSLQLVSLYENNESK